MEKTMTRAVDELIAARAVIADEENWFGIGHRKKKPHQKCLAMAMCRACGPDSGAYHILARVVGTSLVAFNDSSIHADVIAALDRAIEIARAENCS